jgi:hypothetical protein
MDQPTQELHIRNSAGEGFSRSAPARQSGARCCLTPIAAVQRRRRAWVLQRRSSEDRRRCQESPSPWSATAAHGLPSDHAPAGPAYRGGRRCDDAQVAGLSRMTAAHPLPDRAAGRVQLRGCGRAIARPVAAPTRDPPRNHEPFVAQKGGPTRRPRRKRQMSVDRATERCPGVE